ncbi:MAG: phage tail protein [Candidatus Omnitrophica bacterium]|nr:phage tail protein [Candidatus Omnitrophota bacterium]
MRNMIERGIRFLMMSAFIFGSASACLGAINQDDFLINGPGKFAVDIPGCPITSANIQSVQVEDLTIDVRETTGGVDWDFRTYAPGDAHFGKATFRSRVGKNSKELLQWLQDASDEKNPCKNVGVIIRDRKGKEARRWNLINCIPVKYDPGDYSLNSQTRIETIVVQIGYIEIVSAAPVEKKQADRPEEITIQGAPSPDETRVNKGFRIEVSGPAGGKAEDNAWETCAGGALCIEVAPASTGSTCHQVVTPGQKFVEEVQLRGPMTKSRKWIAENINNITRKIDSRFDITIIEIGQNGAETKRYTYYNCFITSVVFPKLTNDNRGLLPEKITIKPERLEIL